MTKRLKEILLNMARLPSSDQQWILSRLSDDQRIKLEQRQGLKLLSDAKRFRNVSQDKMDSSANPPSSLPAYCQELANKAPLYAAIVIEQGNYPWQNSFLQEFDAEGLIKNILENEVQDIKPLVKQALLREWHANLSFEALLENDHG